MNKHAGYARNIDNQEFSAILPDTHINIFELPYLHFLIHNHMLHPIIN